MKYLLTLALAFCLTPLAQADGGRNYKPLAQNPAFERIVLNIADMPNVDPSTLFSMARYEQEKTANRYYRKMLLRRPTGSEVTTFLQTLDIWDCNTATLGAWIRALYNDRSFNESLPSSSRDPYGRATEIINRLYEAALWRTPDRGGLNYYRDRLVAHSLSEGDFVWAIVESKEFDSKTSKACGS